MSDATVRFKDGEADVTFDPAKTDTMKLVAAVSSANEQYKATVKN